MRLNVRYLTGGAAAVVALAGVWSVFGNSPVGPRTYPVQGRVQLTTGDLKLLVGSSVEAALKTDPKVRSSGVIQADGSFSLETLVGGTILTGTPEGSYQARLILNDDADRRTQRQTRAALHARFLQFKTSGWSFDVPAQSDVTLTVSPR